MHVRKVLPILILLGAGTPVLAGLKLQLNVVPTPPDCSISAGSACLNSGAGCSDIAGNSDCVAVGVSPKSKVSLDGNLLLKASLVGVVDNSNAPVTTGAEGSADNYVLQMGLQTCTVDAGEIPYCSANHDVYAKVVLAGGKGKLKLDLKPFQASRTATDRNALVTAARAVMGLAPAPPAPFLAARASRVLHSRPV